MSRVALALSALFLLACGGDDGEDRAGQPCAADSTCGSLSCIADASAVSVAADLAPFPLVCGAPKDGRSASEACERSDDCALGVCLLAGACAAPCAQDLDCAQDERCEPVYARTSSSTLSPLRACVPSVSLPKDAVISRELRQNAWSGGADEISLPATTGPTLFVLEHLGESQWPVSGEACRPPLCAQALLARDLGNTVLFDLVQIGAEQAPRNPVATGDHLDPLTVLVPNGPHASSAEGGYTLRATSSAPGDLRLTTLRREQRGERLDLNVFYVGTAGLQPEGSRGPLFLADALEEVERIFEPAGIYLGEVRQNEVVGELLDTGSGIDPIASGFALIDSRFGVYPELPALFRLSAGAANVALNIFLVKDIALLGAGEPAGLAGGTPVPWGMHGTGSSGVVIAADMLLARGDAQAFGRTLAHEIGHALGLFHTTEITGVIFDPLPDTPTCSPSRDQNDNGLLTANECADAGGDNLMFPTVDASASVLTPDQIDVLRSAFILQ